MVAPCSHTFCRACIESAMLEEQREKEQPRTFRCPCCRTPAETPVQRAPQLVYNMVDTLEVRCPHAGCTHQCERQHLARHMAVCTHKVEPLYDSVPCEHCGEQVRRLQAHLAMCAAAPVVCPMRRFGCAWSGMRRELERASEDTEPRRTVHLDVCAYAPLAAHLEAQDAHLGALRRENDALRQRVAAMEHAQSEMQAQVRDCAFSLGRWLAVRDERAEMARPDAAWTAGDLRLDAEAGGPYSWPTQLDRGMFDGREAAPQLHTAPGSVPTELGAACSPELPDPPRTTDPWDAAWPDAPGAPSAPDAWPGPTGRQPPLEATISEQRALLRSLNDVAHAAQRSGNTSQAMAMRASLDVSGLAEEIGSLWQALNLTRMHMFQMHQSTSHAPDAKAPPGAPLRSPALAGRPPQLRSRSGMDLNKL